MSHFNQVFFKGKLEFDDSHYPSAIYENIKQILRSETAFTFKNTTENTGLNSSHICFGLEDMSLLSRLNTGEHIALRIKEKIAIFEPRITNIVVHFESEDHSLNMIKFMIYGEIMIGNESKPLVLDTNISLSNLDVAIDDEVLDDQ